MTGPTSLIQLQQMLRDRMGALAPGQQRIARLLLADPEGTASRTSTEFARRAEVHESSVVRFARMRVLRPDAPGIPPASPHGANARRSLTIVTVAACGGAVNRGNLVGRGAKLLGLAWR